MISFTHPPTPMNCSTFKSFNYRLCRPAFSLSHASSRFAAFSPFAALFNRRQKCARICVSSSRLHSTSNSGPFMEVVKAAAKQGTAVRDRVAIRADKQSYSYRQIISSALNISKILCSNDLNTTLKHDNSQTSVDGVGEHGHLGGARIGIVAKPSAEFVAGILGTWISGGVAVPLALSYPEAELLHVMNDSEVSVVLSTYDHHESLQEVASKCAAGFHLIPPVPSISSQNDVHDHSQHEEIDEHRFIRESIENSSEDPALIIYTSGTTGKPKGVVHTHKSITAQVQMLAEAWGYAPDDHFLHCLPLHHVHGLFNALLAPLYAGSMVEFMPKFSVRGVWQRWRESYPVDGTKGDGAITVFTGVPTMYSRLIQAFEAMDPELQAASASAARKLRLMMCGSSALPKPVMQQWETITGHCLLERYGMTEFVMAISNPLKGMRKAGTVGKPFPGVQVKIMPEEENGDCTDGVGELCVKSPSLFKEYWKLPEVTKKSFTDDGFFKTGDAGKVDEDGYYVILGRTSADIMKVGGYKLSALEIESVILQHPAVVECCVLGLPDKDYGEAVTVIIVPDAATKTKREQDLKPALTLLELRTWAEDKLAPYKLPTRLLLWDSLPRNAMGKILNRRSHIRQVMQCYPPLDTKSTSQHTIKTPTPGIGRHNNSLTSERDSENGEGERRRAMGVPDYEREARRYLEDLSKGVSGHEMDNITLEGLQVLQARAGFFRCKYLVPSRLSDQDGNWHVGAMATLMDTVGAATAGSCVEDVKGTLELNISYYSKAKIQVSFPSLSR